MTDYYVATSALLLTFLAVIWTTKDLFNAAIKTALILTAFWGLALTAKVLHIV